MLQILAYTEVHVLTLGAGSTVVARTGMEAPGVNLVSVQHIILLKII